MPFTSLASMLIAAPFYLVISGHADFDHPTVLPIYTTMEDCQKQADKVDEYMSGRKSLDPIKMVTSAINHHAFCIASGYKPKSDKD